MQQSLTNAEKKALESQKQFGSYIFGSPRKADVMNADSLTPNQLPTPAASIPSGQAADKYWNIFLEDIERNIEENESPQQAFTQAFNNIKEKNIYGDQGALYNDFLNYVERQPKWQHLGDVFANIKQPQAYGAPSTQANQPPELTQDEQVYLNQMYGDFPNVLSNAISQDWEKIRKENLPIQDTTINDHWENTYDALNLLPKVDSDQYNKNYSPSNHYLRSILTGHLGDNENAQLLNNFNKFALQPDNASVYNISQPFQDWYNQHYGNSSNIAPRLQGAYDNNNYFSARRFLQQEKPFRSELSNKIDDIWNSMWEPRKEPQAPMTDTPPQHTPKQLDYAIQQAADLGIEKIINFLRERKLLPNSITDAPVLRDLNDLYKDPDIANTLYGLYHMDADNFSQNVEKYLKRAALPYLNHDLIYQDTLKNFIDEAPSHIDATTPPTPQDIINSYPLEILTQTTEPAQAQPANKTSMEEVFENLYQRPKEKQETNKQLMALAQYHQPELYEDIINTAILNNAYRDQYFNELETEDLDAISETESPIIDAWLQEERTADELKEDVSNALIQNLSKQGIDTSTLIDIIESDNFQTTVNALTGDLKEYSGLNIAANATIPRDQAQEPDQKERQELQDIIAKMGELSNTQIQDLLTQITNLTDAKNNIEAQYNEYFNNINNQYNEQQLQLDAKRDETEAYIAQQWQNFIKQMQTATTINTKELQKGEEKLRQMEMDANSQIIIQQQQLEDQKKQAIQDIEIQKQNAERQSAEQADQIINTARQYANEEGERIKQEVEDYRTTMIRDAETYSDTVKREAEDYRDKIYTDVDIIKTWLNDQLGKYSDARKKIENLTTEKDQLSNTITDLNNQLDSASTLR